MTFGLLLAGRHAAVLRMSVQNVNDLLRLAEYIAGQIGAYYGFLTAVIVLGGLALAGERLMPSMRSTVWGPVALVVLLPLAALNAVQVNLRPIRADIIYKQADPWDRSGQWGAAVPHYQRAVQLAPHEDFYYLYLGRALLEAASATTDTGPAGGDPAGDGAGAYAGAGAEPAPTPTTRPTWPGCTSAGPTFLPDRRSGRHSWPWPPGTTKPPPR